MCVCVCGQVVWLWSSSLGGAGGVLEGGAVHVARMGPVSWGRGGSLLRQPPTPRWTTSRRPPCLLPDVEWLLASTCLLAGVGEQVARMFAALERLTSRPAEARWRWRDRCFPLCSLCR